MIDKTKKTNSLIEAINDESNLTTTENGAGTYKSTKSAVLDLFAMGGAIRTRTDVEVIDMFAKAYSENRQLALRCLFYLRDIRGGQGERKVFRTCLTHLACNDPNWIKNNLELIPEYGRWDDLLCMHETPVGADVAKFLRSQLMFDSKAEKPSLCAKWMPSENATSKQTKYLAKWLCANTNLEPKRYRQLLSSIRKKIDVVEVKLCKKKWSDINYEHLPSNAMLKYSKKVTKRKQPGTFLKHDSERFNQYITSVTKGTAKIHSSTLYPYDIIRSIREQGRINETLVAQWKALPVYKSTDENVLCLVDTSGSMHRTYSNDSLLPIDASVSLGLYLCEHNLGSFKNCLISFDAEPHLIEFKESEDLAQRINKIHAESNGLDTNLMKVFIMLLDVASKRKVSESDMPSKIIIISDMEFNMVGDLSYTPNSYNSEEALVPNTSNITCFDAIDAKYKKSGYKRPQLIFWNVKSRNNNCPVKQFDKNTALVSGCNPSTIDVIMKNKESTPTSLMLDKLNSERYQRIVY